MKNVYVILLSYIIFGKISLSSVIYLFDKFSDTSVIV